MGKRTSDVSAETRDEIEFVQRHSQAFAHAPLPPIEAWSHAQETSTISVRLKRSDIEAVNALAEEQGVPLSHLIRGWILDGLAGQPSHSVNDALVECQNALDDLRRTLQAKGTS